MRRSTSLLCLLTLVFCLSPLRVTAGPESWDTSQLTTDSTDHNLPQVSGDRVVWEATVGAYTQIFTWKAGDATPTQLTSGNTNKHRPQVSGDRVVWQAEINGNSHVFTWKLGEGSPTQLTSGASNNRDPQVSGDRIVWTGSPWIYDEWDGGVFYDGPAQVFTWRLGDGAPTQITTEQRNHRLARVSGDRIVWEGSDRQFDWDQPSEGPWQVFTWKVGDAGSGQQLSDLPELENPNSMRTRLSGDRVVWSPISQGVFTWRAGDVSPTQLATGEQVGYSSANADVSGDRIAWVAHETSFLEGPEHLYTWKAGDAVPTQITNDGSYEPWQLRISGERIVFSAGDGIHSRWIATWEPGDLAPQVVSTALTSLDDNPPEISGDRVVWEHYDGTHWQIFTSVPMRAHTLTYTAGANGTIIGTSPQIVNYNESGSSVTAIANAGYHFVSWSDGVTTATRTDSNVTSDKSVTANFAINTYTLAYGAGAGGAISGISPQRVNHGASGATVTAIPNTGYHFVEWSDGVNTATRTDGNVTENKSVIASFAINTYTVTYLASGGGIIVGTTPQIVNHGAGGTAVTVVPATGYDFLRWSDGSTANPRTDLNVTTSLNLTAEFGLETNPPMTSASGVPQEWTRSPVTLQLSADDGLGGSGVSVIKYVVGDGPMASVSGSLVDVSVPAEGTTSVEYWSVDNNGNEELPHNVVTVKYDKTAPTTASDAKTTYEGSATVTLSATDGTLSGVAKTEWRLDGAAWTTGTSMSTSKPGVHKLEFRSTDKAGNVEMIKSKTFTVWASTSVSLTGPSSAPAYSGTATIKARLRTGTSGAYLAGKAVVFERWSGSTWVSLGSVTTDANGYASKSVSGIKAKQSYRARFAESSPYRTSESSALYVTPQARLTRSSSWDTKYDGTTYYYNGYIEPKHSTSDANKVKFKMYKKGSDGVYRWKKTVSASYSYYSSSKTKWTAKVVFPSAGRWRVRAYHAADSKNASSYSSYDYVTVK